MPGKNDFLKDEIIDNNLRNAPYAGPTTVFLAHFTVAPTDSGGGTEVTGSGYARQAIAYDPPSPPGQTQNTDLESITASGGNFGLIVSFSLMDALTVGNFMYWGNLDTARTINDGDTLEWAIGAQQVDEN